MDEQIATSALHVSNEIGIKYVADAGGAQVSCHTSQARNNEEHGLFLAGLPPLPAGVERSA